MAEPVRLGFPLDGGIVEDYRLPGYAGVVALGADGTVLYVSDEFEGLLGYSVANLIGRSFLEFVHADDAEQAIESFGGVGERPGYHQALEFRLTNGEITQTVDVVADNRLNDPGIGAILLNLAHPSDRRRSAQLLDRQAEIVRKIALGNSLDSAVLEVLSFVELALPGFRSAAYLIDEPGPSTWSSPSLDPITAQNLAEHLVTERELPGSIAIADEETIIAVDLAHPRWSVARRMFDDTISCVWSVPVRFDRGTPTLGCLEMYGPDPLHPRDEDWPILQLASRLTAVAIDHSRMQARLVRDADVDPLTSTPNRRVVTAMLAGMLERREYGRAVCFIDLDRLKVVNDALGHEAGDQVIREAADRLTERVGSDGIVGRFGGDEFVAIAHSAAIDCDAFAQRCTDAFDAPIPVGGRGWQLSASVGAVVIDEQSTPSEILRDADTAMYEAKRAGRGRWVRFGAASREIVVRRMQLEQTLRDATKSGHISAWFQPVVRAADWSVVGVEALARWEIEAGSWVSPTEFVPLAEELGLIDDLGVAMLGLAIDGYDVLAPLVPELSSVSVNLSPIQVQSERLFEALEELRAERLAAGRRGLPPICFEMTEQHVIDDTDVTLSWLERLTELDTHLAVDDFGSGYSSLARLNRVPADTLKIDRDLVHQLGTPSGTALLKAVVGVARAYGMCTVAEGVETAEQALGVRAMGVDQLQGFLFAHPAPLDVLRSRLTIGGWMWDVERRQLA